MPFSIRFPYHSHPLSAHYGARRRRLYGVAVRVGEESPAFELPILVFYSCERNRAGITEPLTISVGKDCWLHPAHIVRRYFFELVFSLQPCCRRTWGVYLVLFEVSMPFVVFDICHFPCQLYLASANYDSDGDEISVQVAFCTSIRSAEPTSSTCA